jgi:C1A family cysteine protease
MQGEPWQAAETAISQLPPEERAMRLGYTPGPGEQSLAEREAAAATQVHTLGAVAAAGYPPAFDLRNVGGQNYITSIKDQGGCGSCVAFGSCATVEGTARLQSGQPGLAIDLSEAQLFYCIARSQGRTCGGATGGWWPDAALDAFKNPGIADEACYPYTAGDQNCTNLCSNWQSRVTKITGWHKITSTDDMKTWLSSKGPLATCFTVYADFYSYSSGVYKHVSGQLEGGHCVSVVGYDNVAGCWICKNSWGTGWGDGGFFRIAYGQCGIDATMWAVEGVNVPSTSAYQHYILHTGTPLTAADVPNFDFAVGDYNGDGKPDLYCLKRTNAGTNSLEVHVLSGASNYQQFILHTGTPLTAADVPHFAFAVGDYNGDGKADLYCLKKTQAGTNSLEVHVLSGASNYQQFILHTGTPLTAADVPNFAFAVADYNGDHKADLYCLKKTQAGTNSLEVHILSAT